MRISEKMKTMTMVRHLNQNASQLSKYNEQISSGKRIRISSDDPRGTSKLILLKELEAQNKRYIENIEDAKLWFASTEVALDGATELLSQGHTTALQGANDTMTSEDRRLLADQVQQLLEQLLTYANKKSGTKYLFGGTITTSPPFSFSNTVTDERFTSNLDVSVELDNVNLSNGTVQVTSVDGAVVFSEGTDYVVDYDIGTITVLSTGAMTDSTNYLIDYETEQPTTVLENADGTDGQIYRETSQGEIMQINSTGHGTFISSINVFDALKQLKNALYRNDTNAIREVSALVEQAKQQVDEEHGKVGLRHQIVDKTAENLDAVAIQLANQRSLVEDTDMAEAIIKLDSQNTIYNASLQAYSNIFKNSLLDYLG